MIAKLNVNDESCSNHFIQYGAVEGLKGDQAEVLEILSDPQGASRRRRGHPQLHRRRTVLPPQRDLLPVPERHRGHEAKGFDDYEELPERPRSTRPACSFCTRLHFGRELPGETGRYIRLAYSGIDVADIKEGLGKLKAFLQG